MANQKNDENNASFLTPEQENVGISLGYFTNQGPQSNGITFDQFRSVIVVRIEIALTGTFEISEFQTGRIVNMIVLKANKSRYMI